MKRSFNNCSKTCPWLGKCLNGTRFDDGEGGCLPGTFAPDLTVSVYSPCFLKKAREYEEQDNIEDMLYQDDIPRRKTFARFFPGNIQRIEANREGWPAKEK